MTESHGESSHGSSGGRFEGVKHHYVETGKAIGGGIADITYRNIWSRIKDTARGIKEVLGGIIGEPLKGAGKGFEELGQLHPGKAILQIMQGVRSGISRALGGVVELAAVTPKAVTGVLGGTLRTVGGATGLVGLGGDVKTIEGGAAAAGH